MSAWTVCLRLAQYHRRREECVREKKKKKSTRWRTLWTRRPALVELRLELQVGLE